MVYIDHLGKVEPLYLKDIQDPVTGKIPPRGVNLESDRVQAIINNIMHYITKEDYEAARKFISNPEEYDFRKILNW
jgi:6-phosphofructokinase 1